MNEYYGEGVFDENSEEKVLIDVASKYLIKDPREYQSWLAMEIDKRKNNIKNEIPTRWEVNEFAIGSAPEDLYVIVNEALKKESNAIFNQLGDSILNGVVQSGHYDNNDEYQPSILNSYERIKQDFEVVYNTNGIEGVSKLVNNLIGTFRVARKPFLLYSQPDESIKKVNVTPKYVKEAASIVFVVYSVLKDLGLVPKEFKFTTIKTDENKNKNERNFNLEDMVVDFAKRYGDSETIDPSNYKPKPEVSGEIFVPTTKIKIAAGNVLNKEISEEKMVSFNEVKTESFHR